MTASAFRSLAHEPRWIAWRNEERDGKLSSVALAPSGGPAKSDDPSTWDTRIAAEEAASRLANGLGGGIGIQLGDIGADLYLAGLGLDNCLDASGCVSRWAERILAEVDTYVERSPLGFGLRAFFFVGTHDVRAFLALCGVPPERWGMSRPIGDGGTLELHCARRAFTVTEDILPGKPDILAHLRSWEELERLAALVASPEIPEMDAPTPLGDGLDTASGIDEIAPEFSDDGLALAFTARHAHELRYLALQSQWLLWGAAHWREEDTLMAFDLARAVCRSASAEVMGWEKPNRTLANTIASAKTVAAIERLAKADRGHAMTIEDFDADTWVFNLPEED
jgi:hypothetical protein